MIGSDMIESGTVFLIDDDPSVRDSLSLLLSLKGVRTQLFANAESFIEAYRPGWVGCVLTDLRMPGMTALLIEVLGNALRVDRERRTAVTTRAFVSARFERLTEREREILALITAGHQNREVAAQLGISPRTVEVHKARIMEKLGCRSLAELIRVNIAGR